MDAQVAEEPKESSSNQEVIEKLRTISLLYRKAIVENDAEPPLSKVLMQRLVDSGCIVDGKENDAREILKAAQETSDKLVKRVGEVASLADIAANAYEKLDRNRAGLKAIEKIFAEIHRKAITGKIHPDPEPPAPTQAQTVRRSARV